MAKDETGTILLLGAVGVGIWGWLNGWFAQFGLNPPGAVAPANLVSQPATPSTLPPNVLQTVAVACPAGWTPVTGGNCSLNTQLQGSLSVLPIGQVVSPAQAAAYNAQSAAFAASAAASSAAAATTAAVPLGSTVTTSAQVAAQVAAGDAYILADPIAYNVPMMAPAISAGYSLFPGSTDSSIIYLRPNVAAAVAAASPAPTTLAQIQAVMSTSGLSGLGDYQRYIYTRTGKFRPVRVA
jgi:hypothetical protein